MSTRVVTFHYVLTDKSGKQIDSSRGSDPMSYLEGSGQIIPGLELALKELSTGDKKVIPVAAKDAYGDRDAQRQG